MIFSIISYIFRAFFRNSVEKFNAVSLLPFLVFIYLLFISFLSGTIISKAALFQSNEVLFGYLIFEIVLKFISPIPYTLPYGYLYLPVKRKILIHYIIIVNTLFSPFLLIAISFWCGYFMYEQSIDYYLLLKLFFLSATSTIICLSFKAKLFSVKSILIFSIYILSTYLIQKFKFDLLIDILIEISLIMLSYFVCTNHLTEQVSVEYYDFVNKSTHFFKSSWIPSKLSLFKLDWQLVFRNKRPLTYLIVSFLYVLFFSSMLYEIKAASPFFGFLLAAITSIFIIQYGQFNFCWEGTFFDFFLLFTNPKGFITEKFNFFYSLLFLNFFFLLILIVVTGQASFQLIFLTTFSSLFHATITVPMIIFLSFFQQKRIDLEKGAFLNYEGTSGITFLLIISAIAPLGIFYLVVSFAIHQQYMVLALTVVVIIAFSCQKIFRNFLINRMKKNMKYQLSENFNRV